MYTTKKWQDSQNSKAMNTLITPRLSGLGLHEPKRHTTNTDKRHVLADFASVALTLNSQSNFKQRNKVKHVTLRPYSSWVWWRTSLKPAEAGRSLRVQKQTQTNRITSNRDTAAQPKTQPSSQRGHTQNRTGKFYLWTELGTAICSGADV